MNLTPLVSESLQLLWPARCAACDQTIPEAALFCATCSLALNPLVGVCPGCALPRHDDPRELVFAGKRCARCRCRSRAETPASNTARPSRTQSCA
jgi:predicted amidophosphoribosyltransferase